MLDDKQFLRYSRQLLLKEIGETGQAALSKARILIIGVGGLGNPAALYLQAAGVGHLTLADGDRVEISNLPRQILFSEHDLGQVKATAAHQVLKNKNSSTQYQVIAQYLDPDFFAQCDATFDLVLDCSDNLESRLQINRFCVAHHLPLISASAIGWQGQILLLTPPWRQGCYQCLWSENTEIMPLNCGNAGVCGPVTGMMGCYQALQAILLLTGQIPQGKAELHLFNGLSGEWQHLAPKRDTNCPICGVREC